MKKTFLSIFAILILQHINAQFAINGGTGITLSPKTTKYVNVTDQNGANPVVFSYDVQVLGINGFFYPKYHFKQEKPGRGETAKPFSTSIGAPVMLGAGINYTQTSYTYSIYAMYDINFGSCNINTDSKKLGFYTGLGFGIQNTNSLLVDNLQQTNKPADLKKYPTYTANQTLRPNAKDIGPAVHVGIEFPGIFRPGTKSGLRLALQPALNKNGSSYYTLCFQQGFGGNYGRQY